MAGEQGEPGYSCERGAAPRAPGRRVARAAAGDRRPDRRRRGRRAPGLGGERAGRERARRRRAPHRRRARAGRHRADRRRRRRRGHERRRRACCAFQRHATSKLRRVDDLLRIGTLGFRGEALASIAAVSRTTLVTRRARRSRRHARGGRARPRRSRCARAGAPVGTRVEVAELFGNTPARRKFLKAPATEVGHVTELVTRTALAWPQVAFVLRHGGRVLLELAAVEDDGERMRQVFGAERAQAMLPVRQPRRRRHGVRLAQRLARELAGAAPGVHLRQPPLRARQAGHARAARRLQHAAHARPLSGVRRCSSTCRCEDVDVNVHPGQVGSALPPRRRGARADRAGRAGAAARSDAPGARRHARRRLPAARRFRCAFRRVRRTWSGAPLHLVDAQPAPEVRARAVGSDAASRRSPFADAIARPAANGGEPAGFFAALRPVGQVFEGYLVCEGDDQHGADRSARGARARHLRAPARRLRQRTGAAPAAAGAGGDRGRPARSRRCCASRSTRSTASASRSSPTPAARFAVRAVPALLADTDAAPLLRDLDRGSRRRRPLAPRRASRRCRARPPRLPQRRARRPSDGRAADPRAVGARWIRSTSPATARTAARRSSCCRAGDLERWFKRT